MTGAQLKTILQGLGLPPSWFAAHMGVTMRTVVRWFDSGVIPFETSEAVIKLQVKTQIEVDRLVTAVAAHPPVIVTYRTDREWQDRGMPNMTVPCVASWHRAIVFRTAEALAAMEIPTTIEYR